MLGTWEVLRIEEKTEDKAIDWWLLVKGQVFWRLLMFYLLCSETEDIDTMTDHEFGWSIHQWKGLN